MKKLILLPFLVFLLSSSCRKDPPPSSSHPDVYYDFNTEDTIKVPYHTGREVLRFVHTKDSLTDTVTFTGQGKEYDYFTLAIKHIGNDGDYYTEYGKSCFINFKADKPGMDLGFQVVAQQGGSDFYVTLKNETIIDLLSTINASWYNGYFPQKLVNGKVNNNVTTFNIGGSPNTFNMAYTTQYGIIRMELFEKESWALLD